ncbi:MAG: hypothetical protein ACRDPB_10845, partial [Nocardioidaceae bacterium]
MEVPEMTVDEAMQRLGGVAEARTLRRMTSRPQIRVALARGRLVRIARGRYALPGAAEDRQKANELSATLCLDSAARYFGWKLKWPPNTPALAVRRKRHLGAEQRRGVRIVYVDLAAGDLSSDGWATSHVRTVMDCAARLPFDEALVIADSAI